MRKAVFLGLLVVLTASMGAGPAAARQEQSQAAGDKQAISYDKWLAAKASAEKNDADGKFVEALQYYLEYARQAEGLGRRDLTAWGKNNAAYMIIKMHRGDPTVDLAPARRLLEEGLAVPEATEDCRQVMSRNLEYTRLFLRSPGTAG